MTIHAREVLALLLFLLGIVVDAPVEAQALVDFYHENQLGLYRYALSILHEPALAEDAIQEAFYSALKNKKKFFSISCPERLPWIVIIVKHVSLDMLKKEGRSCDLPEAWQEKGHDCLQDELAYTRLVALIRALPTQYRHILELKFVLEWTDREIAAAEGLSLAAVSKRVARGRALLQKRLREEGYDYA